MTMRSSSSAKGSLCLTFQDIHSIGSGTNLDTSEPGSHESAATIQKSTRPHVAHTLLNKNVECNVIEYRLFSFHVSVQRRSLR